MLIFVENKHILGLLFKKHVLFIHLYPSVLLHLLLLDVCVSLFAKQCHTRKSVWQYSVPYSHIKGKYNCEGCLVKV